MEQLYTLNIFFKNSPSIQVTKVTMETVQKIKDSLNRLNSKDYEFSSSWSSFFNDENASILKEMFKLEDIARISIVEEVKDDNSM